MDEENIPSYDPEILSYVAAIILPSLSLTICNQGVLIIILLFLELSVLLHFMSEEVHAITLSLLQAFFSFTIHLNKHL